jgi:hypothetical protein
MIFRCGIATLIPGDGFKSLFNNAGQDVGALVAGFVDAVLTF